MKPIEFKEQDIIIAEHQDEYLNLPAHLKGDPEGTVTSCWKLTIRERIKIIFTGRVWHSLMTFNSPLQPQKISVDKPEME